MMRRPVRWMMNAAVLGLAATLPAPAQDYFMRRQAPGVQAPGATNQAPAWVTGADLDAALSGPFATGASVSWQFNASDSQAVTYSAVGGLPGALNLAGDTVSGALPGTEGPWQFTLRATDSLNASADRTFSFTTNDPPAWGTPADLDSQFGGPFTAGQPVSWHVAASDGDGVTLSVVGGLPGSLALNGSSIEGNLPVASGSAQFTLRATDGVGLTSDRSFTFSTAWPLTCKDVRDSGAGTSDGAYTIDPDGAGGGAAFSAWCDLTGDGGGWTLVGAAIGGDAPPASWGSGTTGINPGATLNNSFRFSDAALNAIRTAHAGTLARYTKSPGYPKTFFSVSSLTWTSGSPSASGLTCTDVALTANCFNATYFDANSSPWTTYNGWTNPITASLASPGNAPNCGPPPRFGNTNYACDFAWHGSGVNLRLWLR